MRAAIVFAGILVAAAGFCNAQSTATEDPTTLVRETVYNELHDHQRHGYFRYWVERRTGNETRMEEQVETSAGPIAVAVLSNGHPLDAQVRDREQERLRELAASPARQASLREDYQHDEKCIGRIMAMLPDAFQFQDRGMENGMRHLSYVPNPGYTAHSAEARVFHALSGDLWIDARLKRMRRLDGHLNDNLDFGMGLLGRVNRGSWFSMARTQVSPTDWKTEQLAMHISGRLLLLKTLARETDETRGGFEAVTPAMSLEQGLHVLADSAAEREAAAAHGRFSPASLVHNAPKR